MIISALAHFTTLRHFFERPNCRYLGKISFMLYLTHRLIGTIVGNALRDQLKYVFGTYYTDPEYPAVQILAIQGVLCNLVAYGLMWLCLLPLALVLANWSTVLVDEPSVRLAKWVEEKCVEYDVLENERPPA